MLKIGLIALVIVFFIIILALIVQSFKLLRQAQKQEAIEKRSSQPACQLHPKLKQDEQDKSSN